MAPSIKDTKKVLSRREFGLAGLVTATTVILGGCVPGSVTSQVIEATKRPEPGEGVTKIADTPQPVEPSVAANTEPTRAVPIKDRGGEYLPELQTAIERGDFWNQEQALNDWFKFWSEANEETRQFHPQTTEKHFEYVVDPNHSDKALVVMQANVEGAWKTFTVPVDPKTGEMRWSAPAVPEDKVGKYVVEKNSGALELTRNGNWENGSYYELAWDWNGNPDNLGAIRRIDQNKKLSGVIAYGEGAFKEGDRAREGSWVNVEKEGIDGKMPEKLREKIVGVNLLRDENGDVYAQEAYCNFGGKEEFLLMVKDGDQKWQMAPYGVGLPNKDGNACIWRENPAAGRKGWQVYDTTDWWNGAGEVGQLRESISDLVYGMKLLEERHPGTAGEYLASEDLFKLVQVEPEDREVMYKLALEAIYSCKEADSNGFWQKYGEKPSNLDEFVGMINEKGGVLDEIQILGGSRNQMKQMIVKKNVNVSELGVITLSERGLRENIFEKAFYEQELRNQGGIITPLYETQKYGFFVDKFGNFVWVAVDVNVNKLEKADPTYVGRQTMTNSQGDIVESGFVKTSSGNEIQVDGRRAATTLFIASVNLSKKFEMSDGAGVTYATVDLGNPQELNTAIFEEVNVNYFQ